MEKKTAPVAKPSAENKRPTRLSTINAASKRPAKPEPSSDKTRRTTLGPSVATAPAKRPVMAPRTNTASPTKPRQVTTRPKQTASSRATKPKPPPSPTKSFISTNDSIPEEPEQATGTQILATLVEHPHASPPKLEIRSMKSSTPALKPQALSDNELGQLPPFRRGHSRTQSAIIPSRPMTAPAPAVHPQEQSLREMEVIQNLLRESTKRDDLTFEIRDLKAEVARLEARNAKLIEASKTASPAKPPMERTNTADASAKEKALKVMLTSQHTAAMDELKAAHKASIAELEKLHSTQLQSIKSELETQRRQSSRLEGVEGKIEAVEDALRESKERASLNEQEVRVSELEKDKLARVIADLRTEIGRCQTKLNDDVLVQKREKKELEKVVIGLKKELEDEREKTKVAADERLAREAQEEVVRTEMAKSLEEKKELEKAVVELRKELKDEREKTKVATDERLVREAREEIVRTEMAKSVEKEMDAVKEAAREAEAEAEKLRIELERVGTEHDAATIEKKELEKAVIELNKEMERVRSEDATTIAVQCKAIAKSADTIAKLRQECSALQDEKRAYEIKANSRVFALEAVEVKCKMYEKRCKELGLSKQEQVVMLAGKDAEVCAEVKKRESLEKALEDANAEYEKVVESHGLSLAEAEERVQALEEKQAEYEKVGESDASTLAEAEERIMALEAEQAEYEKVVENSASTLADAEERVKALGIVVEVVQNENKDLRQKVDVVMKEKDESAAQLNVTIDSLRVETEKLRQRAEEQVAAKEKENADLTGVVGELQKDVEVFQRDAQNARRAYQDEIEAQKELFERLQNQLDEASRKFLAERVEKEAATSELAKLEKAHMEELRSMNSEARKLRQERGDRIEELEELLSDAETERADAEASLVEIKSELSRLQTVLEIFEGDHAETDGKHASALAKLRQELESENATAVEKLKGEMESDMRAVMNKHAEQISQMDRVHEAASAATEAEHGEALMRATRSPVPQIASTEAEDDEEMNVAPEIPAHATLEGTMASLRVQTEQLLEINDDFVAEQKRWNMKLGLPRSSPLRAAS
ncbi:hypothetical protein LTR56_010798 [Elasticomyces elasticus]|nr:hypothetical protein LTR56_010798 [Elasticomyces elasticus]KAK3667823.1 hypothetical protein LTR22_001268 [Elasticomyces elasticus]KAK4932184.1 hypothetical protein LTR49_001481 [Elasticomyces elasticus]KAK5763436.1 hypothetical protein LTS12_006407 [Elasticomyces elasticus]